jgi:AcrR family transcriptional regulator
MSTNEKPRARNAGETRSRLLVAAQQTFAEVGYSAAGVRQIAAAAGVDPALVMRYFGSKAGLYEAALGDAIPDFPDLDLSHEQFGERLTAKFIERFLDDRALAMIVLSAGDPEARAIGLRVMHEHGVKPLADWLGPPDAEARATRMIMLSTGFMFYTRQLPLMSPSEAVENSTSAWLADMLQKVIGAH